MQTKMLTKQQIVAREFNPRTEMDIEPLEQLAASIKEHGILSPLIVRPNGDADSYYVIAGHRRFQAGQLAGIKEFPVTIREDDRDELAIALIENIQREDLDPMEEAEALGRLRAEGRNQRDIARVTGLPQARVKGRLALLDLPAELQSHVKDGTLPVISTKTLGKVAKISPEVAIHLATIGAEDDSWRLLIDSDLTAAIRRIGPAGDFPAYASEAFLTTESFLWNEKQLAVVDELVKLQSYGQHIVLSEEHYDRASGYGVVVGPKSSYVILSHEVAAEVVFPGIEAHLKQLRKEVKQRTAHEQETAPKAEDGRPLSDVELQALKKTEKKEENQKDKQDRKDAVTHNDTLGAQLLAMPTLSLDWPLARLLTYTALSQGGELTGHGLRFTHPNWRTTEATVLKSGERREKVTYVEREDADKKLGEFLDAAQTPEELLTRAIQVLLANRFADPKTVARTNRWGEPIRGFTTDYGSPSPATLALAEIGAAHLSEPVVEHAKPDTPWYEPAEVAHAGPEDDDPVDENGYPANDPEDYITDPEEEQDD